MNIFSIVILAGCLSTGIGFCMEKSRDLDWVGTEEADEVVQERVGAIIELYKRLGLLNPQIIVRALYVSRELLERQTERGTHSWNNAFNFGNKIWVDRHYEELSLLARDSLLGHEIAHIILNNPNNNWLNPHVWAWYASFASLVSGSVFSNLAIGRVNAPLTVLEWLRQKLHRAEAPPFQNKQLARTPQHKRMHRLGLLSAGIAATSYYFLYFLSTSMYRSPSGYRFDSVQFLEEMVCDCIAAFVLPNGGQGGVELYTQSLEHNGNQNGRGRHPYTSTRIAYHKLIAWLQSLMKHKPNTDDGEKES